MSEMSYAATVASEMIGEVHVIPELRTPLLVNPLFDNKVEPRRPLTDAEAAATRADCARMKHSITSRMRHTF